MKVEIDDIEKYVTALNNLIGMDSAYFTGDENVDALVELVNIASQQQAEIEKLQKQLEYCEDEGEYWESKYKNAKIEAYKEFAEILKPYEEKSCCWCKNSKNGKRSSKCDEIIEDTGTCTKLWCVGWNKFESNIDNILKEKKFISEYCNNCGSQRCEGINSEWFEGCKYKNFLNT